MRDAEISGIWCVTMMKIMNSFILTFYLKVALCIQHVLYLVVIKSISWNFDDLKLNFLLWKHIKNKALPDLSKPVKNIPFRTVLHMNFWLKWYIICLFSGKKTFQNFVSAKMPKKIQFHLKKMLKVANLATFRFSTLNDH